MSKNKHPLSDKFDITEEALLEETSGVEIPEDKEERDLDLIIDLALKAYQDLSQIVEFVEPGARIKYYQQMEGFLAQAKDARYKKDKLKLDRDKAEGKGRPASKSPQNPAQGEGVEEQSPSEGVSRKELQERLRAVK